MNLTYPQPDINVNQCSDQFTVVMYSLLPVNYWSLTSRHHMIELLICDHQYFLISWAYTSENNLYAP